MPPAAAARTYGSCRTTTSSKGSRTRGGMHAGRNDAGGPAGPGPERARGGPRLELVRVHDRVRAVQEAGGDAGRRGAIRRAGRPAALRLPVLHRALQLLPCATELARSRQARCGANKHLHLQSSAKAPKRPTQQARHRVEYCLHSYAPAGAPQTHSLAGSVWHEHRRRQRAGRGAPRSRMTAFQWFRRSQMSSLAAASRPSERIFAVVRSSPRGLLGVRRAPGGAHAKHVPLVPRAGFVRTGPL